MAEQPGFFDSEERLKALSAAGDPLERLAAVIDFELFHGDLERALARSDRSKGGRLPPAFAGEGSMMRCWCSCVDGPCGARVVVIIAVGRVHSCVRPVIAVHDRWP
jgi:hypothetical protein